MRERMTAVFFVCVFIFSQFFSCPCFSQTPGLKSGEISIPLREPEEFDFKTKTEILDIRKGCVARCARLAPESYQPSEEVFGRIEDGKPWWGLLGLSYYGNGKDSISGASEESRFILNPLLLVGINHTRAYRVKNSPFPPFRLE
jgi:hypothetical protein